MPYPKVHNDVIRKGEKIQVGQNEATIIHVGPLTVQVQYADNTKEWISLNKLS